jgi:hypothetical protein
MKCSKCSEIVAPVVACDIDGTLAEYHLAFADFAWLYWNAVPEFEDWTGEGEFEDYLHLTKAQYREAKLAFRQGGYKRNLIPYDGTFELTWAIEQTGAELWLCTARPWLLHDSIDPDTVWWLHKHDLPFENLIYGEDKYAALAARLDGQRVVMVLDDLPEMYDAAEKYFPGMAVQISRPHNSAAVCTRPVRAPGLAAAQRLAVRRIKTWKEHYGHD